MSVPNKPFVLTVLSHKTVVNSFTLRCWSPRQSPGLPGKTVCSAKVAQVCRVCLWGKQMYGFMINCFLSGNTKYVRLKVLSKGVSCQGSENKACSFSYVSTSYEDPFFFLWSFLFLASDVVDLVPVWYVALYLAITLSKSSTTCSTALSTPELM